MSIVFYDVSYVYHNIIYFKSISLCVCVLSRIQLFATPWTVAHQAPLSTEFSRQEHWSGLSFPSPGGLPDRGTEPRSPALTGGSFTPEALGKPHLPGNFRV